MNGEDTYSTIGNTWRIPFLQPDAPPYPSDTIDYIMVAKNPLSLRAEESFDFAFNEANVLDLKTDEKTIGPISDPNGISLSDHNAIEATVSIVY